MPNRSEDNERSEEMPEGQDASLEQEYKRADGRAERLKANPGSEIPKQRTRSSSH